MNAVLVPLAEGCEEFEAVPVACRHRGGERGCRGPIGGGEPRRPPAPDTTLDEALQRDYDMVVLPGAKGAGRLEADARVTALLTRMADDGRYTAAICGAPRVLAAAGLLRASGPPPIRGSCKGWRSAMSRCATPASSETASHHLPRPGTAMDFALCLIELLAGQQKRDEVEAQLAR